MKNELLTKIIFYSISILIHANVFYLISINLGLIVPKDSDKEFEVLEFTLTNPVVKSIPPPEVKKPPPPKQISTITEVTEKPEEEQVAEEQVVQEFSKKKVYEAFYKIDSRPSFKNKAPQRYPLIEKRAGKEGIVVVEADIDEHGILQATRILKSDGENFTQSALEMIQNSTYNPGIKNGSPIPVRMRFTIRYKLKK